ncbi:MAG: DUF2490 domain-containing protein [Pyrinomonadaceae bacterium]|jgi:hypothetical protein
MLNRLNLCKYINNTWRLSFGKPGFLTLFSALVFILSPKCLAQNSLPTSDFQIRSDVTIVFPAVIKSIDSHGKQFDRLSFFLTGAFRLGQNRLYPVDERIGGGFDLQINKFVTYSNSYIYRRGEPLRNRKEYEHRLFFDLTVGKKWPSFSIKNRSRVEYRFRNSKPDTVRYRNKFTFAFPLEYRKKPVLSPFFADEVFYDFHEKHWSMNEFSAGITRKLSSRTSADFYYLRRDTRSGQIRSVNSIGVSLKIHL